jgi:hypothetical protein
MGCLSSKTVQHVVIVENMEPASPIAGSGKKGLGGATTPGGPPVYRFDVEERVKVTKIIGTKGVNNSS